MLVDTEDLALTSDLARRLGYGVTTISNWKKRYSDFPEPVARLGDPRKWSDVYLMTEVIDWYNRRIESRIERASQRVTRLEERLAHARDHEQRLASMRPGEGE